MFRVLNAWKGHSCQYVETEIMGGGVSTKKEKSKSIKLHMFYTFLVGI